MYVWFSSTKIHFVSEKILNSQAGKKQADFRSVSAINHEILSPGVNYRVCELHSKIAVSHDTFVYVFNLPMATRMCVPVGYHVFLKFLDGNIERQNKHTIQHKNNRIFKFQDELTIKPYTVIDNSLFEQNLVQKEGRQVCLMIKHYDDGAFTSKLKDLPIGFA